MDLDDGDAYICSKIFDSSFIELSCLVLYRV